MRALSNHGNQGMTKSSNREKDRKQRNQIKTREKEREIKGTREIGAQQTSRSKYAARREETLED
jgi:hypothetical protein